MSSTDPKKEYMNSVNPTSPEWIVKPQGKAEPAVTIRALDPITAIDLARLQEPSLNNCGDLEVTKKRKPRAS